MNDSIKEWYLGEFPSDDIGHELNSVATFKDLLIVLDNRIDVYELLGVADSIVRERAFKKLSEIMDVDYDHIYYKWLNS